jgi:uncharacterized protein YbjT (DUF2867 family)
MNILIFGATGMVGQGVLRECLLADDVRAVTVIGRSSTGIQHAKLTEIIHADMYDYHSIESRLQGFDGCFFCLGVSSVGMKEAAYRHISYDLTLAAATTLQRLNPAMVFTYVSGAGTDSTEQGRVMWARVKGATENALQGLGFKGAYLFRPGAIIPMHGETSKTPYATTLYTLIKPLLLVLKKLYPNKILTTELMGQAMLNAVRFGAPTAILETGAIRQLALQRDV